MSEKAAVSGYLYALSAAALWSLLGPLSRFCFAHGMEPLEVAFWRAGLGGLCFGVHAACCGELRAKARDTFVFIAFGIFGVAVFFAVFQFAIRESGAALAVVLLYTAPAWVAVFSRALFHENLSSRKLAALCVALIGTLLVCLSGGSLGRAGQTFSLAGILCGLASGFTYAAQYPFFVWWKNQYANATLFTYIFLSAALVLLPFLHISLDKPCMVWLNLAGLGVLTTYGAYWAYGQGLRRISPVRAVVLSNLEPVLGTFWAWTFWNENFSPLGWGGSVLVLAAVFLLTTDRGSEAG